MIDRAARNAQLLKDLARSKRKHNTWRVASFLLASEEKFVELHVDELERDRGTYDIERKARQLELLPRPDDLAYQARNERAHVRSALVRWFWAAAAVALVSVAAAAMSGTVHPSLPVHWGKVLQIAGGCVAVWGTLLAVDGPARSWSGVRPAERAHTLLYSALLTLGATVASVGTLISP